MVFIENTIDIELPLWIDLFSVIFMFLVDGDYFNFLTVSKQMLELVKNRAVFWKEQYVLSLKRFEMFYFSCIELSGGNPKKQICWFEPISRQRFLRKLIIPYGVGADLTKFSKRNSYGNFLFPHLNTLALWGCSRSLSRFRFWDFLREYPKRISLAGGSGGVHCKGENLKRLVEEGKYDEFHLYQQHSEKEMRLLTNLDVKSLVFHPGVSYTPLSKSILKNEMVSRIVFLSRWDLKEYGICWEKDFKNLKVLELSQISFPLLMAKWMNGERVPTFQPVLHRISEISKKKNSIKKFIFRGCGGGYGYLAEKHICDIKQFCRSPKWSFKITDSYDCRFGRFVDVLTLFKNE